MKKDCLNDREKVILIKNLIIANIDKFNDMSLFIHNPYEKLLIFLLGLGINRDFIDSLGYPTLRDLGSAIYSQGGSD